MFKTFVYLLSGHPSYNSKKVPSFSHTTIRSVRHMDLYLRSQYVSIEQCLTFNLLTTTTVAPPSNASKWQMGFNSVFKGLTEQWSDFTLKYRVRGC